MWKTWAIKHIMNINEICVYVLNMRLSCERVGTLIKGRYDRDDDDDA